MKKLLLVFLGLVVLAQGVKLWERGYDARSARRNAPAVIHQQQLKHGGMPKAQPKIMLT